MLKVVRVKSGLLWDRAIVEAKNYNEVTYDSFLGERTFYLSDGHRLNLRVKKKAMLASGDKISMGQLVKYAVDWADVPWGWS